MLLGHCTIVVKLNIITKVFLVYSLELPSSNNYSRSFYGVKSVIFVSLTLIKQKGIVVVVQPD